MPLAAERKLDLTLPQRVSREQLQEVLDRAQADQRNAAWVCMALDCSLRGLALLVEHHGLQYHPWVQRMLPARRSGRAPAEVTGPVQVQRPDPPTEPVGETREERRARREREAMMEEWPPERRRRKPTEEQVAALRELWEAGIPPREAAEQIGVAKRVVERHYTRFAVEASAQRTSTGDQPAKVGEDTGAGAPPVETREPQDAGQPQAVEAPAAARTDQAEAEQQTAELLAQEQPVPEQSTDLLLELVDVAATPQHLCARCIKADVCPAPEALTGHRPEVPVLPGKLAGAVEVEVAVVVRSCRYYVPTPAGEEQRGAAQGQGEGARDGT